VRGAALLQKRHNYITEIDTRSRSEVQRRKICHIWERLQKKNEENLRKLAEKLKIEKYVAFLGYVPDEKLPDLYAASDIFVLPALYENFPFAILEAQSTGLPVISTKVGGIPEFLADNKNGCWWIPGDSKQLAERIMTLLQDPELAEELGGCGRRLVEEKFAWPLITSQVVELYRKNFNVA